MIAYKLTDQNMQTYNNTQWQLGEWKETNGEGGLCGPGWLHYYSDPFLAVLLNPIHADFQNPRLFEAEVAGRVAGDNGLKFGCTKMRLVKELQLPVVSVEQRTKFAILCALEIDADPAFATWANNWLNGTGRTTQSAVIAVAGAGKNATYWATWAAISSINWTDAAKAAEIAAHNKNIDLIALVKKAMER